MYTTRKKRKKKMDSSFLNIHDGHKFVNPKVASLCLVASALNVNFPSYNFFGVLRVEEPVEEGS